MLSLRTFQGGREILEVESRRCSCFLLFLGLASKQINTAGKRASRDIPAVSGLCSDHFVLQ